MTLIPRSPKITATHLERKAVVYIRQSTLKQVQNNTESLHNQRALVERAQAFGWNATRIEVLDADLGHTAATTEGRNDFTQLAAQLAEAACGHCFWLGSFASGPQPCRLVPTVGPGCSGRGLDCRHRRGV